MAVEAIMIGASQLFPNLPHLLGATLFYGGIIGLIFTIGWLLLPKPLNTIALYPTWSFNFSSGFPFKRLIRLDRASQVAYEKLKHTAFGEVQQKLKEGSTSNDNVLKYYAHALVEGRIIYGKISQLSLLLHKVLSSAWGCSMNSGWLENFIVYYAQGLLKIQIAGLDCLRIEQCKQF